MTKSPSTYWTSGYVADIPYTYGYFAEMNPYRVPLSFINAGLLPPKFESACELGFGQGVSINVHAAASSVRWYGTDFLPGQTLFARQLAEASAGRLHLFDESFQDFCVRPDLPEFDFIGLHGIWSWVSDENRKVIVDFLSRKLKVGGVLYVSYNAMPGWSPFAPVRHLLAQHSQRMSAPAAGSVGQLEGALAFAQRLLAVDPFYARTVVQLQEKLDNVRGKDRVYLAHEYLNQNWTPMYFSSVAETLSQAKLTFACSAHYLDYVEVLNLSPEQQTLLAQIPDPVLAQDVRDFIVNQQFRRDYWVKGAVPLSPLDRAERLREERVVLLKPRKDVPLTVKGPLPSSKRRHGSHKVQWPSCCSAFSCCAAWERWHPFRRRTRHPTRPRAQPSSIACL
jgi:hypothetical protein